MERDEQDTASRKKSCDVCNHDITAKKITARNTSMETPLHVAAFFGNIEIMNFLLRQGADVSD